MKNWKMQIALAIVACASTAHADLTYKWVQLSQEQMNDNKNYCTYIDNTEAESMRVGAITGGAMVVGTGISVYNGGLTEAPVPVVSSGVAGAVSLVAGVKGLVGIYLKKDELLALVYEQQGHFAGLMTQKLEQIAFENSVDPNRLLAGLNASAIQGSLCTNDGTVAHPKEMKSLVDKENKRIQVEAEQKAEWERASARNAEREMEYDEAEAYKFHEREEQARVQKQIGEVEAQLKK